MVWLTVAPSCSPFFGTKNWSSLAAVLIKSVDRHLVLAVLDPVSRASSPGMGFRFLYPGFMEIYLHPKCFQFFSRCTGSGKYRKFLGYCPSQPNTQDTRHGPSRRPAATGFAKHTPQWFTATPSLQCRDLILAITPQPKKAKPHKASNDRAKLQLQEAESHAKIPPWEGLGRERVLWEAAWANRRLGVSIWETRCRKAMQQVYWERVEAGG